MEKTRKKENIYFIAPESVIVPKERIRKEFDPKDLRALAESIQKRKQDTPGICYLNEEKIPVLIAGERRLRACIMAERLFAYRLETSADPLEILEIEVEENIYRVNLTWVEKADAISKLHDVKQAIHGINKQGKTAWGERETAEVAGQSLGKTHEEIELSAFAGALPEVRSARTRTEAKKIVKRVKEDLKRSKALEAAREKADSSGTDISISEIEKQMIFYEKKIHEGKMEAILPKLKQTYDLVIFDPPWGVGYDKIKEENSNQENYEDNLEFVQKSLPGWLTTIYKYMAENSHLYLFFGIVNHEFIYNELEKVGFETNRIPIIWHKQGAGRTRNPEIWPGRSYEPIAYARKGKKALVKLGASDVIITPAPTSTIKKIHPSAKHPLIYLELLQRSASPGNHCLDPMCGSGMLGPAAEVLRTTHQLEWTEIEINERYCELAVDNAVKGFYQIWQEKEEEPINA